MKITKVLLLSAVCLAACRGDALDPSRDLIVSAAVAPSSIKIGAIMEIGYSVQNTGAETYQIGTSGCFPNYEILDQSGAVVGPGPRFCTLELRAPLFLAPKSVLDGTDHWNGEAATNDPTSGPPLYVPPGTYNLRPRVQVVGSGWVYGALVPVTVVP